MKKSLIGLACILLSAQVLANSDTPSVLPKPERSATCPPYYTNNGNTCVPQSKAKPAYVKSDRKETCAGGYHNIGWFCAK